MEIKTRFDIGDKVWTLSRNKAVEFEVCSISISRAKTLLPITYITYCGAYSDGKITIAPESDCFASKEELINRITS